MTRIPIVVKTIDEVAPDASMEREFSRKVITSCPFCGGIYFYCVVNHIGKAATDTDMYCCQCGHHVFGIFDDPFNELDESGRLKKEEQNDS